MKGFYHIWAWWPSWSCDIDPANKLSFPHPTEAPCEIWLDWPSVLEKKIFENGGRMTDNRPWLYYKLTNEPKGSGELKTVPLKIGELIGNDE